MKIQKKSKNGIQCIRSSDNHKWCSKCEKIKLKSCFYKNKNRKDGLSGYCKECVNIYQQKDRENGIPERE
ncbi:MAG: hypothetical protein ACOCZ5_01560 [bacterium]